MLPLFVFVDRGHEELLGLYTGFLIFCLSYLTVRMPFIVTLRASINNRQALGGCGAILVSLSTGGMKNN
jgi:hypothetical protein